jgi:hypothetical protein
MNPTNETNKTHETNLMNSKISAADLELLTELRSTVLTERQITLKVIELLKRADDRNLYLTLGYDSLLEFCMKDLKYSETSAKRRIYAMQVCREMPEIEKKIEGGDLSLSVVVQASSHLRRKEKMRETRIETAEKKELFQKLEGLSIRQTEITLFKDAPEIVQTTEKLRQVSDELQELKIILTPEMQQDLEKLKFLLSHSMPGASLTEVLKFAVKESIKKRDLSVSSVKQRATAADGKLQTSERIQLPVSVKREVWRKSQGQCCYRHEGRRCNSRFQLEVDHIISLANGGTNVISNLQLLCRKHNQMKGFSG